ncbi:hypothetical protein IDJ75_15785 [Mucilaginibacter rigui]|uniref:DUF3240 domain-containing protein n=1 Tax=Mucilaginibacter rigui TaxID=534635 RepID=A0ABR7X861_9SPHI|nr:hypothetical protein [Mucilaginibacter rigui]MBD1386744.1 hypothetical protein [Mucilaginibacter rigui]
MKILIVTCLKEYLKDVARIFKQSNIDVFSTNEITGHRDITTGNLLEEWFASGGENADSMMIFTFTAAANAGKGLELIKIYNEKLKGDFPIRAFIMPVERAV